MCEWRDPWSRAIYSRISRVSCDNELVDHGGCVSWTASLSERTSDGRGTTARSRRGGIEVISALGASADSVLRLRGPEVKQDQSRGCVCPVGGALDAEGLSEGWGRRRSTMKRTNQQTGMHRPWGDFCVYRSALTPGAGSECGVQRVKGMRALSVLCLPFPPFLADRAALFPVLLVLRPAKVRPSQARATRESVTSTPSSFETAHEICLGSIKMIFIIHLCLNVSFFENLSLIA
ncbi:uncharacterized protein LOC118644785 [Monomorium pharaonis]|uniref:uncharacterized protein LOC118644785 n=1 Tax=Monomorium pharaonis TaxID=307658 RepID=UPI001745E941|nr:uncharacterized protein LOC118644785 [Monomorium pharaonis]